MKKIASIENTRTIILILGLLVFWEFASYKYSNDLLPTPFTVLTEIIKLVTTQNFYIQLLITFERILVALLLSFGMSFLLEFFRYTNRTIDSLIKLPIFIFLIVPQTVIVFITMILLGASKNYTIIVAVIICLVPNLLTILSSGIKSINKDYLKMAKIYNLGWISEYKNIILPGIFPYISAAIKTGVSVGWRTTMLAEMFIFNGGIGYQIYYNFQLFSLKGVLSWTVSFLIIMGIFEYILNHFINSYNQK